MMYVCNLWPWLNKTRFAARQLLYEGPLEAFCYILQLKCFFIISVLIGFEIKTIMLLTQEYSYSYCNDSRRLVTGNSLNWWNRWQFCQWGCQLKHISAQQARPEMTKKVTCKIYSMQVSSHYHGVSLLFLIPNVASVDTHIDHLTTSEQAV